MDSWISNVAQHGYLILFAVAFLEAIGIPVPAALAFVVAGAAGARGPLNLPLAFACGVSALLMGDVLMFLMGRYTGWWLLGILCRLSLNPESCILRSADSFYRRGRTVLVIAKFLPGVNTMAPALAGSMNMRIAQFLRLDLAGAALYAAAYLSLGFVCSGALGAVTRGYRAFGHVLTWILIAAVVGYLLAQLWMWRKSRAWRSVPFIGPSVAAGHASAGGAVIYDVRSHGYYDPKAVRIQGSIRLDPNAFDQLPHDLPTDKQIYVYCTCIREATSARVAHMLREKGAQCSVIQGGLRAWRKAGLPLEPVPAAEMAVLPVFDS